MIREGECKSFLDKMYRYNIDGQVVKRVTVALAWPESINKLEFNLTPSYYFSRAKKAIYRSNTGCTVVVS